MLNMSEFRHLTKSKIVFYLSNLLFRKYNDVFPFYMFIYYILVRHLKLTNIITVPTSYFEKVNSKTQVTVDPLHCCFISQKVYKYLTLLFGEQKLLRVQFVPKIECSYPEFGTKCRFGTIYPLDLISGSTVVLSDLFQHNIGIDNLKDYRMELHIPNRKFMYPKIATRVNISFVNNHFDVNHALLDSFLNVYFEVPRLLHVNELFQVCVENLRPELLYTNLIACNRVYFFKCIKIDDTLKVGYCVKGETELTQTSNLQSYVPKSINWVIENQSVDSFQSRLLNNCPFGFEEHFNSIEKSVLPFLSTRKPPQFLKPAFLVKGILGSGKEILVESLALQLGLHLIQVDCTEISSATAVHTETKLRTVFAKSKLCSPCILLLNNFQNLCKDEEYRDDARLILFFQNELHVLLENNNFPIILICSSNSDELNSNLERIFLEIIDLDYPSQEERLFLLKWLLLYKNEPIHEFQVDWDKISRRTHSFLYGDLDYLVSQVLIKYYDKPKTTNSFLEVLDGMQETFSDSIGAPKIPKVYWEDIGGLSEIKREIIKTINYPLKYQHLLKDTQLKRSGLLLYGPPGTGKTLIAKAVATECGLNFLSIKGPELLNMYVGQSELNVREVFTRARQAAPCIIFFDELDSLAPNRGMSGDSGGVMDRVVSQLLSEMDGLNDSSTVFIIGATNRPDLIDPALLRPGRFDKLLYVGISTDDASKLQVLKALTRKLNLTEEMLKNIVDILPDNITGADLQALCSNAWLLSAKRRITVIESGNELATGSREDGVTLADFIKAVPLVKPSVTRETMQYYAKIQKQFEK